jgi:hypothetical protein
MDDADSVPDRLYDLGVLFVHGIGQTTQGETLLQFGEPLVASIEHLAAPQHADGLPVRTSVAFAHLKGSPDTSPAHAELRVDNFRSVKDEDRGSKMPQSHWLLAEAWWAERFPTPTYRDFALGFWGVARKMQRETIKQCAGKCRGCISLDERNRRVCTPAGRLLSRGYEGEREMKCT